MEEGTAVRDMQLRITEDGQVYSRGILLCTVKPGDQVTLESPGGAFFLLIHRESSPGRREQSRPKRQPAQIRKLHVLE